MPVRRALRAARVALLIVAAACLNAPSAHDAQAQGDRYDASTEAERLLKQGLEALREARESGAAADWSRAAERLRAALREDPKLREAHVHLGFALYALGQHEEAVERLESALAQHPSDPELQHVLGLHLFRVGRAEEGAAQLDAALAGDETPRPDAHFVLGKHHLNARRYDDARAHFERYLTLEPDSPQAHQALGVIHYHSGRYAEAEVSFEHWAGLAPQSVTARVHVGDARFAQDDLDGAIESYQSARTLAPERLDLQYGLASLFLRADRHREALEAFEAIIEARPGYLPAHYFHAEAALALGELDLAQRGFEATIELKSDYAHAHLKLAEIARRRGQSQQALESAERAASLAPDDPEIHALVGDLYRDTGDLEGALREHRVAVALNPTHAPYYEKLGDDLLRARDFEAATARFREAQRLEPESSTSRRGLSIALLHLGGTQLKEGKASNETLAGLFKEALDLGIHTLEARVNLAAVALSAGQVERARALTDEALAQAPRHAGVRRLERRVLLHEQRYAEAEALLPGKADRDPHDWHDVAVIRATQGRWDAAGDALERARKGGVGRRADLALLLIEQGINAAHRGRAERAEALLSRAYREVDQPAEGTRLRLTYALGAVALRLDDFERAAGLLEKAAEGAPALRKADRALLVAGGEALDVRFELAYARYRQGQSEAAVALLATPRPTGQALALYRALLVDAASAALERDETTAAIEALETASRLGKRTDVSIEHNLAVARYLKGQRKKAVKVFTKLARRSPPVAEAVYNLAVHRDEVERDHRGAFDLYLRYLSLGDDLPNRDRASRVVARKRAVFGFEGGDAP